MLKNTLYFLFILACVNTARCELFRDAWDLYDSNSAFQKYRYRMNSVQVVTDASGIKYYAPLQLTTAGQLIYRYNFTTIYGSNHFVDAAPGSAVVWVNRINENAEGQTAIKVSRDETNWITVASGSDQGVSIQKVDITSYVAEASIVYIQVSMYNPVTLTNTKVALSSTTDSALKNPYVYGFEAKIRQIKRPILTNLNLHYTLNLPLNKRYDISHVSACLQGLVNREAPRLFVAYPTNEGSDLTWLGRLQEPNGLCQNWATQKLTTFEQIVSKYKSFVKGVILYDPDPNTGAISTSLVATTAAGVEGALAVRKDTSAGSVYNYLVNDSAGPQFPVLIDLSGKFTGTGTIWQTTTPSTGSKKCDAYIWAKQKYLDTGKCNPKLLSYTLDLWGMKYLYWWQTENLDYAVANKAFCFELSPWGDETPNDDPTQPLGTDLNTFKAILNSCNVQTGQAEMIRLCGFPNAHYKYCNNPNAGGIHGDVDLEWEMVRLESAYNVYMDADAGLPIANASFYAGLMPVIRDRRFVQNPVPSYNEMVHGA